MIVKNDHELKFDVSDVAPMMRTRAWRDLIDQFFFKCDNRLPEVLTTGSFAGWHVDNLTFCSIKADANAVTRTDSHIGRDLLDAYLIFLPTTNSVAIHQRRRDLVVDRNQLAVISTKDAYTYAQETTTFAHNLIIPGKMLRHLTPDIDDRIATASMDTPLHGMFIETMSALCEKMPAIDQRARTLLGHQAVEFLALVMDGADHRSAATPVKRAYYRRIIKVIDQELGNRELGVSFLATKLGLSPRYLQQIFADHDTTASHLIRERRIVEARRLIRCWPNLTISEVAFRVGFGDLPHFSRVFKAETGVAPSCYRAGQE